MTRRRFITLIGGAAAAWPIGTCAQPAGAVRRIAVLMPYGEADPSAAMRLNALRTGRR